jgi:hypothetical protein
MAELAPLALAPLMRVEVTLEPVRDLGQTPAGHRRIIGITGGRFSGARLSGRVLPGGADWQVIRGDGVAYLDARYTLETTDGALVYVNNKGYRHGPPEVLARVGRGEDVDPADYYMRATPWFETAAPAYAWLNRIICVCTGARRAASVELDFYEVK